MKQEDPPQNLKAGRRLERPVEGSDDITCLRRSLLLQPDQQLIRYRQC